MVNRFLLFVVKVPEIEAYVAAKYPEGSYERKAFERLKALVPDMEFFAEKLVEADSVRVALYPDERQRLRKVALALQDAGAILQETNFDVEFF